MAFPSTGIHNWSIYKITNPKGRIYIGVTSDIKRRYNDYLKLKTTHQPLILRSMKKYGLSGHDFSILETFDSTLDYAMGKEIFWIKSYMSNIHKFPEQNGMNLTNGGQGNLGYKLSEETKEKLRQANLGKKYSKETRKMLSDMRKGKKIKSGWTEGKRQAMREQKLKAAYRHTEEAKKKISAAGMGKKNCLGKKQTKEHIESRINSSRKPVQHFSIKGDLIKEYLSIRDASKNIGVGEQYIGQLLLGNKNSKKYILKYKTE